MRICVGICGSIAAYRSVDFVKELVAAGHEVRCVLTQSANEFVAARSLEVFSGFPILKADTFDKSHFSTDHIETARWAEVFVVYGATAHTLARLAQGLADDFLSLQLLAFEGPVVVAPAMNPSMWRHPAVRHNVELLVKRGTRMAGPLAGKVACGEEGEGHLATHELIRETLHEAVAQRESVSGLRMAGLHGKRVLISAGPMRTFLDPVRMVQNRSSGKMGYELALACREAGANVTVLLGPVSADVRALYVGFEVVPYEGPADYESSLAKLFPQSDVFFSAAAVLDFEFVPADKKIERSAFAQAAELRVPVKSVEDIVAKYARKKTPSQKVIAFAAETGTESEILERAQTKMLAKGVDAMIANPVWPGLGPEAEQNQVWILRPQQATVNLGPALKRSLARPILEALF